MSDFIDRAKLEALADDEYPVEHSGFTAPPPERCGCDECYVRSMERLAFLAGAAAYAALLDAETTEEWGVQDQGGGFLISYDEERQARALVVRRGQQEIMREVVSRRVLYGPWIPSKGGEKRG